MLSALERIEAEWKKLLDYADDNDDDGGHVGISRYYRNKADGLAAAMRILREEGSSV